MTLQEIDKKISELQILRKSIEKMEIRKFQEEAKKNVGRCFILNGNYLRIVDIPPVSNTIYPAIATSILTSIQLSTLGMTAITMILSPSIATRCFPAFWAKQRTLLA